MGVSLSLFASVKVTTVLARSWASSVADVDNCSCQETLFFFLILPPLSALAQLSPAIFVKFCFSRCLTHTCNCTPAALHPSTQIEGSKSSYVSSACPFSLPTLRPLIFFFSFSSLAIVKFPIPQDSAHVTRSAPPCQPLASSKRQLCNTRSHYVTLHSGAGVVLSVWPIRAPH